MIKNIRNFCIIAHIDHGKSTLADRLLEITETVSQQEMMAQVLDSMELERERGITIKSHAITMNYQANDKQTYILNLIDTPGHVDFAYEVSRSLAACEGALLVVDASQGIEAQTLTNVYLALENDLTIIPVINKIDLPSAQPEIVKHQLVDLLGIEENEILEVSAKTGLGMEAILDAIVQQIPAPTGDPKLPLQALIFDSMYNPYRGAVAYIRIFQGEIRKGTTIRFFAHENTFEVDEVGILRLKPIPQKKLSVGQVGYLYASVKEVQDTKVGDTITDANHPAGEPLPGYREVKPMVYSSIYPSDTENYEELRSALEKLKLNDAALTFVPEDSTALGFGFRCGFLGLLHMEIVQERLEREYDLDLVTTVPSVIYNVTTTSGELIQVNNPMKLPDPGQIEKIEEPYVKASIMTPAEFLGNMMQLAQDRRGIYLNTEYLDANRANLHYELPLGEIIFDFYDRLKSLSKGYASFDYEFMGFKPGKLQKVDVLLNREIVDALSVIVHADKAYEWGRRICDKLKELIPRQLYEVAIQAAIGSKIISRSTIPAIRKNVTAKCYGGDITRKRKLLERQKEGKRRMKQLGKVDIPQEAFLAILKVD